MKFKNDRAEIFVPDGAAQSDAIARTTVLGVGAHQDDLEMMAMPGILQCMREPGQWFTGVTCTDGAGSPRCGAYADYTNDKMMETRWQEQRAAAMAGRYSAMVQLKYTSAATKDAANPDLVSDLASIMEIAAPETVFTHNPADKHDTHVAVAIRVLSAVRSIPPTRRPTRLYGAEIWRALDWLPENDKTVFDLTGGEHTAAALLGVFDSQIAGGKRYDLAALGRWRANATFLSSHAVDKSLSSVYALDLSPLIRGDSADLVDYTTTFIDKLKADVSARIRKFS